ncbi:MAG: hypothetical protein KF870_15415 [Leadbetterella sp.]|nr:hypothetical protein [Leadbetterella sp.]
MKKIIALLLLLLAEVTGYGQNYIYIKDIPATVSFPDDFEEVSDNVNKKYTHLSAKNINGDSLKAAYMTEVKAAKTNLEYGDILIRYFSELKNSHASVIFKKYYIDCSAILVEDRVFLSYAGDSTFIHNHIKAKDEILKINNIPVLAYITNHAKYTSASTALHAKYLTVSGLFSSYYEEDRTFTIKTATGEKDITVHFEDKAARQIPKSDGKVKSNVESKMLNDSVAYIAIQSMTGNVVEEFTKAFDSLGKSSSLIIDLRRNQGGNSGYSEKITEYLISSRQKACVSNRWLNPRDNHFQGKLFVLTSPYTVSAAESLVIDLQESGSATLVGMPTAGDTGNQPRFYSSKMGYSYWFPSRSAPQVSPKGFPMEGKSIQPLYPVSRTVAEYLEDKDTILNYALTLIK